MILKESLGSLLVIGIRKRLWLAILKSQFSEAFFNRGLLTVWAVRYGRLFLYASASRLTHPGRAPTSTTRKIMIRA